MTKEENIKYLTLRSEECRLPAEEVAMINKILKTLKDDEYDHLKRISEPAFRAWCKETCTLK
ncbi:MAG: hypothetical protein PF518_04100 [Spirochaetaceae bacterium]|jgi:hypothetical protein|nr:hypothetical protein [Spirochaetaceae bacterium]